MLEQLGKKQQTEEISPSSGYCEIQKRLILTIVESGREQKNPHRNSRENVLASISCSCLFYVYFLYLNKLYVLLHPKWQYVGDQFLAGFKVFQFFLEDLKL